MEKAYFAAGCFWGIEETFRNTKGVTGTSVGYGGGKATNPTYKDVCDGNTGHAEVVEVEFNLDKTSYQTLLGVFWQAHDPTTLNRQGPDVGTQYRSALFTLNDDQHQTASASKQAIEQANRFGRKVVTEVTPFTNYHLAEDYHQQYIAKRQVMSKKPSGGLFSSAR